jgi:large subunit ribosomal protein L15
VVDEYSSNSPGFEGGQMPLYRRMPKLVGRPMGPGHVRANYGLLKLDVLNKCEPNSEVTYETCLEKGLMTKVNSSHFVRFG